MKATHAAVYFRDDGYWYLEAWFPDGSKQIRRIEDVPHRDPEGSEVVQAIGDGKYDHALVNLEGAIIDRSCQLGECDHSYEGSLEG
jgi:hypothetical protein